MKDFFFRSYLAYARGESKFSPWMVVKPFSVVFRGMVRCRSFFYDHGFYSSQEPPIPVISVGNLVYGGTNKTPFVEMITQGLKKRGIKPAIVSRGYGGKTSSTVILQNGDGEREVVGDEPLLLSQRLPDVLVSVSSNRMGNILALVDKDVDVVVADDAFQHRSMGRDVDIVLIDATCPFGNGSLIPGGILREPIDALKRADIVVVTRSDQVSARTLDLLMDELKLWVPEDRLFRSRFDPLVWHVWDGEGFYKADFEVRGLHAVAFSAIGSPGSFIRSVSGDGLVVAHEAIFKDHHRYSPSDMRSVENMVAQFRADVAVCTEKDVYNLPEGWKPGFRLLVPKIKISVEDEGRFWDTLASILRPRLLVVSNGHGEDAIGVNLANKLKLAFPGADVAAFPLVGRGDEYARYGVEVLSPPTITPTGGIIKYRFRDLMLDLRSGLLKKVAAQFRAWRPLRGQMRTPVCVGDTYLLAHTLWGQGQKPLLLATAKTTYISGHLWVEEWLYRHRALKVWTRDEHTARDLEKAKVDVVYEGNPIMDLVDCREAESVVWDEGYRVLLLPGSRERAYKDLRLLLDCVKILSTRHSCAFYAVIANTLELDRVIGSSRGWEFGEEDGRSFLCNDGVRIYLYFGDVADCAREAQVVIGLGGTANQVCAGMGLPIVSILEKGKLVQKKIIGDAEILVPANPKALAEAASRIIEDEDLYEFMSKAGLERLGKSGALDGVVRFCATELGWDKRNYLYSKLTDGRGGD